MSAKFAYVLVILVALIQFTSANFDLYHAHGHKASGPAPGVDINVWARRKDLSHGRKDIHCEPEKKCGYDHAPWPDVNLIEMHFTNDSLYHYTIYKKRGYTAPDGSWRWYLYGIDECFAWGDYNWDCQWPSDGVSAKGYRKFRCLTNVDANTINAAFHKESGWDPVFGNATAAVWDVRAVGGMLSPLIYHEGARFGS
ncbi:hypothetical protein P171DRAFT_481340 [Karstenula rhodostoma CBS 690.94]|uniref:Uncharacterized protein n=1 Tax=Karstenula rhodostoma CBS 690.94 TaxID=1392251 RepID=A0A9P4PRZ7_9PLEO|nr:hypothetical protein P171DRAFT_481340 [Karstenula rhodostoma CBS 690.94]